MIFEPLELIWPMLIRQETSQTLKIHKNHAMDNGICPCGTFIFQNFVKFAVGDPRLAPGLMGVKFSLEESVQYVSHAGRKTSKSAYE